MTRAPRPRKKKAAPAEIAAEPLALVPVPPAGDAAPAPADADAVSASAAVDPPEPASADGKASVFPAAAQIATTAPADAMRAAGEAATIETRSSMRVEVTEDRSALGQRLRAAREIRGWSREDVAHRLHVPTTVVADIEGERFDRLGAPVYVRGYLGKYAALVELPPIIVNRALDGLSEPALKPSTDAPQPAPTWERYRVAVIGGLITLAVAVPMLTLVANRGIHAPVPQVRSLDEAEMTPSPSAALPEPVIVPAPPVLSGSEAAAEASAPAIAGDAQNVATAEDGSAGVGVQDRQEDGPDSSALMASMAGFSTPPSPGTHVLEANFREDSWIEIFDAEGRVIEQNLVRAGQARRYQSTGAVSVKIGNVGGVDLRADGNPIDLAAHARANVARLRLFEPASAPTP